MLNEGLSERIGKHMVVMYLSGTTLILWMGNLLTLAFLKLYVVLLIHLRINFTFQSPPMHPILTPISSQSTLKPYQVPPLKYSPSPRKKEAP